MDERGPGGRDIGFASPATITIVGMVVSGCINPNDAYDAVSRNIITPVASVVLMIPNAVYAAQHIR